MRRTGDWIGLPIIETVEGCKVGEVKDIRFDQENQAASIIVEKDGLLSGRGEINLSQVKAIGEDAITIESVDLLQNLETKEKELRLISGQEAIVGKELFTENGSLMGTVADVYIGAETDNIVGYEVSDGLLADLVAGRKWIPYANTLQIGEQIIVKANTTLSDL